MQLHFEIPACGTVHCDDARSIIREQIRTKTKKGVTTKYTYLAVDEDELDIFSPSKKTIPEWEPFPVTNAFKDFSYVCLDIETLRVNNALKDIRDKARQNQIKLIGLRSEKGKNLYLQSDDERQMLIDLFHILEQKQPDFIFTYNGMWFDMPFILERATVLGVAHLCPFWINYERQSRFASAEIAGRPWNANFRPVYVKLKSSGKKVWHIDLFMRAIAWDAIMRKADSLTLKVVPVLLKLRKDDERLTLSMEEMEECYENGDYERMKVYLGDDLEDTELLARRFVPELINAQAYFPTFNYQTLATIGVGTQWNATLTLLYGEEYAATLPITPSARYQGALTYAVPLFAKDVVSYDFSGQYPTCMTMYCLTSIKDPKLLMLAILIQCANYRLKLKYKSNPTQAEKDFVTTVKGTVNGSYGFLASKVPFGDPHSAALVTAFARARLKWSRKFVEAMGGEIVLTDTDSLYIRTDREDLHIMYPIDPKLLAILPPDASPRMLSAIAIGETLKKFIPSGSKLDLDSINEMMFIPPAELPRDYNKSYKFKSVNARKLIQKIAGEDFHQVVDWVVENIPEEKVTYKRLVQLANTFDFEFPKFGAVRKNYAKKTWVFPEEKGDKIIPGFWKLSAKGRFVKRVVIKLQREFQQQYMLKFSTSPAEAEAYYHQIVSDILDRKIDMSMLITKRKIAISETKLLKFGEARSEIQFYIAEGGEPVLSTSGEPYSIEFYLDKVQEMHQEIHFALNELKDYQEAVA